jgi:hypothetical protein
MNTQFLKSQKLGFKAIEEINTALVILRHFIELNAKLLPLLHSLNALQEPSARDLEDMEKIKSVFSTYRFESNSSLILMNSPVLEIIQMNYETIFLKAPLVETNYQLNRFQKEYANLAQNWNLVAAS